MSRQSITDDPKQSGSQEALTNALSSLPLQRLCAGQSELMRDHDVTLQKTLDAIKTAFQKTEDAADGKAEETFEEKTAAPRCILSYAWPSDTYQEKEAYVQPFLDFLYEHLATAGIEVHLDFREPQFDTTDQRETIYDIIQRHYRPGTFIVLVGTESLRAQHDTATSGPMQFELDRVRTCLSQADGSVYPLLLSGTRDSAYPDDIAGYIKIQNAENLTYLNLLQQLIDRLYSQDTQSYWEALETSTMLPENTEAITEALSHQLHQNRLTDLQQTPAYQTIQMQRQKKISKCLSTKLFIEYQKAMGEPIQHMSDEHGFMFQRPPENDHFIKRPALLTHLSNYFLQPGRQLLTLTAQGLGGVGKTQLAQHVYLHPPQPYPLRAWFQASSREQLSLQYIDLGKAQGVKFADDLPIEEKVARVLRWLEQQSDCLLMYDDVRDKAMLEGLLPQTGSSHILITTRHGKAWPVSQCLDVDVMEPEEAKALIEKIAGEQDPTDLETLVHALGKLPLALAQAAWYMRQENCAAGAYLTLYQERQVHLMQHTEGLPRSMKAEEKWVKHEAVWVTFDINFQMLKQTCPKALLTLNQASWLASTPIPEMLLQSIMDSQKTTLPERLFEWTNIKKQLTAYSLMQIDVKGQTLLMHNLVQDILRDQQSSNEKIKLFEPICDALDSLYIQYHEEGNLAYRVLLAHAECLYQHNELVASLLQELGDNKADLMKVLPRQLGFIYQDLGMPKESLNIFQHERSVLEKCLVPNHPDVAETLVNLGSAYGYLGDAKRHCELQEQALALLKSYYGAMHPKVAVALMNLGTAHGDLGDAKQQCILQTQALTVYIKNYGAKHPEVAKTLTNLGSAYGHMGDAKRNCELQEQALAIMKLYYDASHPKVASVLVNLGIAYGALGDMKKQCELQTQALDILKRYYGAEHPKVANALADLGIAYGYMGDAKQECELQTQALAIKKSCYGATHPKVARTLMNLGNAYGALGDVQRQCDLQTQAMTLQKQYYGAEHPEVATTLMNLGNAYRALGDVQQQCELQTQALAIQKRYYGVENPKVANTLMNLGNAYGSLGDVQRQCDLQTQALAILKRYYGSEHPEVAATLMNLGAAYGSLGDEQRQCELQTQALGIEKRYYGAEHPNVAGALVNLGNAYGVMGDVQRQCELQTQALAIQKRYYGAEHPALALTLANLGNAYGSLGDVHRKCELQTQALAIKKQHYGAEHPEVAKTLVSLGNAYGRMGDVQQQCNLQTEALGIQKRHYGADHPEVAMTLVSLGDAYGALGDVQRQYDLQTQALAILKQHYGAEHREVAKALISLGNAYGALGDVQRQCELQTQALAILKQHYGSDILWVATTLVNLGNAYGALDDVQQQCELQTEALSIYKESYGPEHPEVAGTLVNLGNAYGSTGDAQRQCELQTQALAIYKKYYGAEHPRVAITLMNLGNAYSRMGDAKQQCELQMQALVIQEKIYGLGHPEVANTLHSLAIGHAQLNHITQALEFSQRACQIYRQSFPQGHPNRIKAEGLLKMLEGAVPLNHNKPPKKSPQQLSKQGIRLYKAKNYIEALPFFQRALEIQKQEKDSDAEIKLASCYFNLGSTLFFLERYDAAKPPLESAYHLSLKLMNLDDHIKKKYKSRYDTVIEKLHSISLEKQSKQQLTREGVKRYKAKDYEAALPFFQQVLALQQQSEGPDAESELAVSYFNVGSALFFLEQYEEAKAPLEQCYQLRLQLFGLDHKSTQKVKERMEACYEQGASQKA